MNNEPILIVGTGALATLFAVRLAEQGHDITMLGTWDAGLEALTRDGARLADTAGRELSYRVRVTRVAPGTPIDKAEKPLITAFGQNSNPRWSPDGTRIAFVSNRGDHTFIGVYDVKARA